VDRLDGLEFDVTFQLDSSFHDDHHHYFCADDDHYDNDKPCSHNDKLAGVQWIISIL